MIQSNTQWILQFVIMGFGALLFYLLQRQNKKIDDLEKDLHDQELLVMELKGKLWSDEKLTKVICVAVKNEFNAWENKMLKNGYVFVKNRDRK